MAEDGPVSESPRTLDRSKLQDKFEVLALEIPAKRTGEFMKKIRSHLLNLPRRKNVEPAPCSGANLLLLSRRFEDVSNLPSPDREWVLDQISQAHVKLTKFTVSLGYEHFTAEEVLRKLLPSNIEVPSSFEQAGHVCHLNLRDSQLPFRHLIAQVILDKNKSVKTVVNKVGKIETEFRTFPMEHLAGDPSTVIRLKEQQCWFEFEYRDVYWNSRLQGEHARLIDTLFLNSVGGRGRRPVLADCTCGIGPFSLPVVKQTQGIVSHANDLNPESVRWLARNAEINKLPCVDRVAGVPPYGEQFAAPENGSRLVIHEPGDARDFVRGLFQGRHPVSHALFNLPATGVELLDCFRGLAYADHGLPSPLVCCYTFSDAAVDSPGDDGCVADLLRRLSNVLDVPLEYLRYAGNPERDRLPLPSPQVEEMVKGAAASPSADAKGDDLQRTAVAIRLVRNVAPTRHMFCVCFQVPAYDSSEPMEKRAKMA
mmetsp:Transcript_17575/g.31551  ORF Transcript_17575/g.31551 Transcript_17575/m.31551 type:complete len:482 (-) Transcript_17575:66-1511(-)